MKKYLFTTSRCPKCPEAKQYVADNNLTDIKIIVADEDEKGAELAEKFGVQYVPTFIVEDGPTIYKLTLDQYKENKDVYDGED